jgi:hypothetical protein
LAAASKSDRRQDEVTVDSPSFIELTITTFLNGSLQDKKLFVTTALKYFTVAVYRRTNADLIGAFRMEAMPRQ